MKQSTIFIISFVVVTFTGCNAAENQSEQESKQTATSTDDSSIPKQTATTLAKEEQLAEIEALVDQLVFAEGDAKNQPVLSPGISDNSEAYRKRFESCTAAFQQLTALKDIAFPVLLKHLDDKRESIQFRNHYINNSVGNACYWNIYYQLQDRPDDYSQYGYSRMGKDGKNHPKPYWEGTPFDEAGGLREWLSANADLSYTQKQIECLQWLLEKEKIIGAPDDESYRLNILPLEIQILKRRLEMGDEVDAELKRLRKMKANKSTDEIDKDLSPFQ